MKKTKLNIELQLGSIPAKGTHVWYIRANMISHKFVVVETQWIGGVSDLLRMAKGNVFFSTEEANEVEGQLNSRLGKLKEITRSIEFERKLAEDAARKKAEFEERKRKREEARAKKENQTLPSRELAAKHEAKKKIDFLHPDIIA